MPNPFVHCELNSTDVAASKKFYKRLFQWTLKDEKMADMRYTMIDVGKGTGGGILKQLMPNAPSMWLSYVEVDDVKKTIAKAEKLGAKIYVPYKDVGMGSLGIFEDPTGAVIGVWQAAKKRKR
jgi:predicted enzyme related to lactoylglutathione lyase